MKKTFPALRELVRFARDRSPFYRHLYRDLPEDIDTITDLPVIHQDDFWAANVFTDNKVLTGPIEDGILLKSGGTTGKPKFSVFSRDEWAAFTAAFAAKLAQCGIKRGDRVANLFYVGDLYGSFLFTHEVLEKCPVRILQLPIAGITPMEDAIKTMQDYGATVVAGLPTTLMTLTDAIERAPQLFAQKVRTLLFAGEPMQLDQRERVRRAFPASEVRSIGYVSSDSGLLGFVDAGCGPNEFRIFTEETIFEILDEVTGEPVVQAEVEGRIVVTDLKRRLMPILRYPAGDRAAWVDPPESPNRKFRLLGRSEESARIASLSFHYDEIGSVLQTFAHHLGPFTFQVVVIHHDARDGLVVRIAAEPKDRSVSEHEIRESLYDALPIYRNFEHVGKVHSVRIEWREPGHLETHPRTGKLRRIIDLRLKSAAEGSG